MHLCSKCIKPQPDIKREGEGAKFIFETIIMNCYNKHESMNYKAVYCSHPTLTRHCSQFDIIFSQLVKAPTTTLGVLSISVVSIRYSECERV